MRSAMSVQQLGVVLQTPFDTILYYALLCLNIIPE
jgi:hypothetical protein